MCRGTISWPADLRGGRGQVHAVAGLAMFKGRFASRYGEMMAVSVLLTLPIIVLFFFTQKTFIQGIKTSG